MSMITKEQIPQAVERALAAAPVTDLHTHIFSTAFGDLLLWGVDELVTYHYLIAENFRYTNMPFGQYFKLSKKEQSELIWKNLFLEHSPVSEAQRGVLTALNKLGLDVGSRNLASFREFCSSFTPGQFIDKVFQTAGVKAVVMTNDPFDARERAVWLAGGNNDSRFLAALRLDPLLNAYEQSYLLLQEWGYAVDKRLDAKSVEEIKRFLREWAKRMKALYMAVSLPPTFAVPEDSLRSRLIEECVIPVCRELDIPFAMMIGVNKRVNNALGDAGDSVGKSSVRPLEFLCEKYPDNKFLVTMLARENQHELAVTARKFRNLLVFGCWWFLNNPVIVEEMTRMRMELLGLSFVPQHSDARILDQLLYKWDHSRKVIAKVLVDKYSDLLATGWKLDEAELNRDVAGLMGDNFWQFVGKKPV